MEKQFIIELKVKLIMSNAFEVGAAFFLNDQSASKALRASPNAWKIENGN